jgi:hypothetical protein
MGPVTATSASRAGDSGLDAVRSFARTLKIACDELHDDPFNPEARSAVLRLLENDWHAADAVLSRVVENCRAEGLLPEACAVEVASPTRQPRGDPK